MLTLNQLIKKIETFAQNHNQLKGSFYFGDEWEAGLTSDTSYPLLLATLSGTTLSSIDPSRASLQRRFVFSVMDLVHKDESNERDVLSDTELILLDLIAYFNKTEFPEVYLSIDLSIQITDFTEKFDDEVSGWFCEITFKELYDNDVCQIPII